MNSKNLANLAKIGSLKAEPPAQAEFDGLLRSGRTRLNDALNSTNALESRFTLAYDAAHALALAALRWYGYRSEKRYLVFQTLKHTLMIEDAKWRVLDLCHEKPRRMRRPLRAGRTACRRTDHRHEAGAAGCRRPRPGAAHG